MAVVSIAIVNLAMMQEHVSSNYVSIDSLSPTYTLQEHGKLCVCLGCAEDDEAEPDDNELPHKYKGCTAEATSCTARTG